jgi:hypothetical protein
MTHHTPSSNRRNRRTFIANLLAYVLLTSQLAPMTMAFNRSTNHNATAATADIERQKTSEAPPHGPRAGSFAPVPAPLRVTALGGGPVITATKVDTFPDADGDGKVSPGQTITYSVTITNTGDAPATNVTLSDTVDPNTTIVPGSPVSTPIGFDDAYSAFGNVRISTANGAANLLANDINPNTGNNSGLTVTTLAGDNSAPFAGTSAQGGQVDSAATDGTFSYNPPPGFTGTDTFTYTVTSANGNDTRTVTITVGPTLIWFINNDPAAPAGNDGRITSPFNSIASYNASLPTKDPNDIIFIYQGTSAYTGNLTLVNGMKLIGQGFALQTETGAPPTGSDPLPGATANPTINSTSGNTVTLAQNNTIRGLTLNNSVAIDLIGNVFGTLTTSNLTISGTGRPLSLTTGTLASTIDQITSTSSSGGQGILLSSVGGTLGVTNGTSITGSTTQGILVTGSTVTANFGNTTISGGTDGVSLQNNSSGTRTFGTLTVSGNTAAGFLHGAGGGATNVTGATNITNPGGAGIDIQNSNAAISFAATTVSKNNAGTGVNLATNGANTTSFSSLAITVSSGAGLVTNAGGSLTVTTGSITATGTGAAASLTNTTLNLTFTSISSNNGANGIIISGGSGSLTSGTTTLQNNAGIGLLMSSSAVAANFGNTTVNSSAGDGVDLSSNTGTITFADLDITPDANLRGLDAANNTGTITSTSGDIATTGAPALNIAGPAGRTPLAMTLTNVDSTNSTTLGIDLNLVSGNLTVNDSGTATNIQGPAGVGIQVQNTGAGTINLGNTVVNSNAGTGVFLNNNLGAVSFGSLDITPDLGVRGLHATDNNGATAAGAITSTSGTITTVNNTAVEITGATNAARTPLNVQFTKISATASGGNPPSGIRLQNTSATSSPGGFRVLGTGGTCTNASTAGCSGGEIGNTTGGDSATASAGSGIHMENVDTVSFTRMHLHDHSNYAIRGVNVNGFTLNTSVIKGTNGTNPGAPFVDGCVVFDGTGASPAQGLVGSSSITNSDIRGGRSDNLRIDNSAGTLNLTVSGSTFRDTVDAADASDNIFIELDTTATGFVSITGSTFGETSGDHIQGNLVNTAVGHFTITGNTMTGIGSAKIATRFGMGVLIAGGTWTGTCRYNISNNTISGTRQGHAIHTNKGGPGGGTMEGTISGNTIGVAINAESGASESSGITVASRGNAGVHTAVVSNNTIHQVDEFGINLEAGEDGGLASNTDAGATSGPAAALNVTVTGNTVDTPGPNALHGIHLNSGILPGDNNTTCADIGGAALLVNTVPTAANEGAGGSDIRPRQRQATRVNLPGYSGTAFDSAAVNAYMTARNILTSVAAGTSNATGTANDGYFNTPGGAPCTQPTPPTLPSAPVTFEADGTVSSGGGTQTLGAPVAQTTATSNIDSITSRPFISSPRQQPAVTGDKTAAQVVRSARPGPLPEPTPIGPPPSSELPKPQPPVITGDTLTWNVGTLPAGQSVTITFQVVVDNPFMGAMPQVSNQGTVTADGGISVLTDDPSTGAPNDPTITGVTLPPDLFVRDASVAEPASGSTSMIFTLALSTPAPMSGITVNLSTTDITATGGDCPSGNDYTTVTGGTVTFNAGEQIKTFPVTVCSDAIAEGDETFSLNVNSAPGANIADGQGIGTITANVPGTIMISELRTSGPGGAGDDFVEIYNNTDTPHTVPAGGYGLFKRGATCDALPVLLEFIPAGTMIPQRGHYLFVGSAYSLANYGGTGAAAGNKTLMGDIESDFNVGLFSTVDPLAISTANRLDAVGFGVSTGGVCDLLLEGTTLQPASGSTSEHSFVREFTLVGNDVPTPTDANDNAADFTVISTTPDTAVGSTAMPKLGAPGPENLANPRLKKFSQVGAFFLDQTKPNSMSPNRVRDLTPVTNGAQGTISIRRRFINNTGGAITRLRFRIYDISTRPVPTGTADLRALSSLAVTVGPVNDTATCAAAGTTPPCTVTVQGTTVEEPPAQPNGGGLNSSMSAGTVTMATPVANGASINLQFLFGVQQGGSFRVFVFVEALP